MWRVCSIRKKYSVLNGYFFNNCILNFKLGISDGGVMVSIVAFQAVDPGSIPGHRTYFSSNFADILY